MVTCKSKAALACETLACLTFSRWLSGCYLKYILLITSGFWLVWRGDVPTMFEKLFLYECRPFGCHYKQTVFTYCCFVKIMCEIRKCYWALIFLSRYLFCYFSFFQATKPFHGCLWVRSVKNYLGCVPFRSRPFFGLFSYACYGHKWQVRCSVCPIYMYAD